MVPVLVQGCVKQSDIWPQTPMRSIDNSLWTVRFNHDTVVSENSHGPGSPGSELAKVNSGPPGVHITFPQEGPFSAVQFIRYVELTGLELFFSNGRAKAIESLACREHADSHGVIGVLPQGSQVALAGLPQAIGTVEMVPVLIEGWVEQSHMDWTSLSGLPQTRMMSIEHDVSKLWTVSFKHDTVVSESVIGPELAKV